ncbi:diguanylate cyclase [Vibrio aestuarianus]|uniref:diguanylate cyclase n=1 Tax=Vibrio aestuarianus TaxID=28171 RepID=UPI00237CA7F4|nr:diguanylate cyclase [Vibrio aestuarianus]MDE1210001.1 diguanylate cyclase [Vibrio aestuarianus]MDE1254118.1 diguanylate cyclase [Vibrio aestuarianus]MDE1318931.1 diguanylate cyclase [Vibrio aestuarianus]
MAKLIPHPYTTFMSAIFLIASFLFITLQSHAKDIKVVECDDFLACTINNADQIYLQLYQNSFEFPEKIKDNFPVWPSNASPRAQALYIFAQKNLQRFSGIEPQFFHSALDLGKEHEVDWIIAESYLFEAQALSYSQRLIQAEAMINEVIEMAEGIGYKALIAKSYNILGNIAFDRGNFTQALKNYQFSYQIFQDIADEFQITIILNNISTVYIQLEDWKNADFYLKKALSLYQDNEFSNILTEATLYTNASVIDSAVGRMKSQQRNVEFAFSRAMNTGSKPLKFKSMMNLADSLLNQGQVEDALDIAERCLSLAKEESEAIYVAYCHEALAEVYLVQERLELALLSSKLALTIFEQFDDIRRIIYTTEILSRIFESQGDYPKALSEYKKMAMLEKDLLLKSRDKEALSLKVQFNNKLNEQELLLLSANNNIQKLQLETQNTREWLYRLLFVIVVILSYLSYRKYRYIKSKHLILEKSHAQLEVDSTRDPLTNLYNRRYLSTWFLKQKGTETSSCVLAIIDIDFFKKINDKYGHEGGDEVLRKLSKILHEQVRPDDLVMRWGGEEFVMIIKSPDTNVKQLLERIRTQVEKTIFIANECSVSVTVSIGAKNEESIEQLELSWKEAIDKADQALYQAKSEGRNRCIIAVSSDVD